MSDKQTGGFLKNFYLSMYPGLATKNAIYDPRSDGFHIPYPDVHPSVFANMPNVMADTYKTLYPWAFELEHTVIPGNQYYSTKTGEVIAEDFPIVYSSFPSSSFKKAENLSDKGKNNLNSNNDNNNVNNGSNNGSDNGSDSNKYLVIEKQYNYDGNKDDTPVIILFRKNNENTYKLYESEKSEESEESKVFENFKEKTNNTQLDSYTKINNALISGSTTFSRSALKKKSDGLYQGSVRIFVSNFLNNYNNGNDMNVRTTKNSDIKIGGNESKKILQILKNKIGIDDNKKITVKE